MFCSKCGAKTPDGYEFCKECGTKIEVNAKQDNENIVPVRKKKNIKRSTLGIIIFAVIVVIGSYYLISSSKGKDGLYNNISWGTSLKDIKSMVDEDDNVSVREDDNIINVHITDYEGMQGIDGIVSYKFENEKLNKITVLMLNGSDSKYTDSELIDVYIEKLNKLYGEAEPTLSDYTDGILAWNWESKKSKITLSRVIETLVVLDYEDITKGNN